MSIVGRRYYVYILGNRSGTLYIGVTNNIERRLFEHRTGVVTGFSRKYKLDRLLYLEETGQVDEAIAREKELKAWRRQKKLDLVRKANPRFEDLAPP
jgi:putative endonuclease